MFHWQNCLPAAMPPENPCTDTHARLVCRLLSRAAGHARVNGEPYVLLDRSLEEVVQHIAKDLNGRIKLSWPVTKVTTCPCTCCSSSVESCRCDTTSCQVILDHLGACS